MARKFEQIVAFNETKVEKASDTDVQYLEHKESMSNHANWKASAQSAGLSSRHAQQAADKRSLRVQMRTESPVRAEGKATAKNFVQEATAMTPEQEKQIRDNFGDDSQSEYQPRRDLRNERKLQTPSRVGAFEPELRSQKRLRSAGPKPKSPSPVVERWTAIHPDWADNWRIDLVYERTVIGKSDVERLDEGQLLNDEIITLYLKYLHKQLESRDEQLAKKVYIFNSFFWEKLRSKRGTVNYEGVKNWTAKVDLLSFDYIIVPINEHAHWYVAIICNAKGLLSPHNTSEIYETGSDKPQDQAEGAPEDDVAEATANDTMKKIAVDVSHISIDDDTAEIVSDHHNDDRKAAAAKKPKNTRKGSVRKYDPKAPMVVTLDSLGGQHSVVNTALKIYLQHEIEAKKGLRVEAPATFGTTAKDIPTQPNFTDCGVYLLGYMREFMKDPHKFTKNILQREARDWDVEAPTLRNEIRDLIFKLQEDYQREQERKRRERAQVQRQKQKPQGQAMTSKFPRSSGEPPVRESPAPPSGSAANSRQVTPLLAERDSLRAVVNQDVHATHEEDPLPRPAPGDRHNEVGQIRPSHWQSRRNDTSVNVNINNDVNNASMIVNVDESIEGAEAHGSSIATVSKPVESIEVESDDEAPESTATRERPQRTNTKTATSSKVYDERKFLAPLLSSSASSSPVKADPVKNNVNRESLGGDKTSGDKGYVRSEFLPSSQLTGTHTRTYSVAGGKVTRSEVIPSSSEGEGVDKKGKKKKSRTIDLTSD